MLIFLFLILGTHNVGDHVQGVSIVIAIFNVFKFLNIIRLCFSVTLSKHTYLLDGD